MKRLELFSFFTPTRIEYGAGKADQLIGEVKGLNSRKPLIVTDGGIIKAGILKKIEEELKESNLESEVYSDVESNPRDTTVEKVADLTKEHGLDLIIAVGGGSPMDVGKAAGMLVTNGGRVHDYFGHEKVKRRGLPLITIPTTAGTGSEVTCCSVVTDTREEIHRKEGIGSPLICPTVALVDPLLTTGLPPHLTAFTGMDALTHAIEAYSALVAEPITDALALSSIQLIIGNLAPAVLNGENLKARDHMMLGSMMAGIAFSNSAVTAVHCLGETIGGFYDIHHGLIMAILLPHVMEYNLVACPEKFIEIAKAMGENVNRFPKMEAARKSVEGVTNLSRTLRIPTLKSIGIKEQDFEKISTIALTNVSVENNPRKMTLEGFEEILKNAYKLKTL